MRIWSALDGLLQAQRGHLFPWVPVFFGLGISFYFIPPQEPGFSVFAVVLMLTSLLGLVARRGDVLGLCATALLLTGIGFCYMGARANLVAAPVLKFRYYGAVEGQVVKVDRSASDAMRITLRHVRLDNVAPERTPHRVRLSLFDGAAPAPGAWVMTTAHLSPPQGPAEPGGFDFRRHAWFQKLGAVGYSRVPVLETAAPGRLPVATLRMRVSRWVREGMPERTAGVAAALVTGDRAHVPRHVIEALRASNLAHLLAISGLHMGLFAGLVFASLRRGLALWPAVALRYPVKKISACIALCSSFGYLLLSGANVATERAFLMVAMVLIAVVLDRRALSIRAVALAACLVLLRRPETLLSAGFQMSFAATLALVAAFQTVQPWFAPGQSGALGSVGRWIGALVLSSLVAGLATAPFGAANFNTVSHYGLIANLVAVPVMGAVVVPGAVFAICLAPIGASAIGFWIMTLGLDWILTVAETVSSWPGAKGFVVAPEAWILPVLVLGGLVLLLWQGRLRALGLIPVCVALAFWPGSQRPDVLIAADGGIVGILTPEGRAVSRPSGKSFVAGVWLENDGDGGDQETAFSRWQGTANSKVQEMTAAGHHFVHAIGKTGAAQLSAPCQSGTVIILTVDAEMPEGDCMVLSPKTLRRTGSVAFTSDGGMVKSRDEARLRLWSGTG
ncbi:ComEC/Rec2 family competence protein [Phaeobacter sp. B1627]|uniref:ComEC/Rec2 family competence protein n=1 Tax=Phaeobacter sp. B1627 TaxID=2583809 RepID=UPI00111A8929|nr:ComEC/Rec2 family competence protein [Phaeobacter sp. B1627]TNJ46785.1 ComEC family competence protein [Phaeobacter sp. B1627]